MGELVDDGQALDVTAFGRRIEDEVVGPNDVGAVIDSETR
jgi:hypothetical protein